MDVPVGHPEFGKIKACGNVYHAPEKLSRIAMVSNLDKADLAKRLTDITVNDGNREMILAARGIIDEPYGWLYIWGGPGNAKSEVLVSVVNECNLKNKGPAMYVKFAHLLNWVAEAFRDDADESYLCRFNKILRLKVLAIDEVDKARGTKLGDEFRFQFLDERYRQGIRGDTVTIFASNSDPTTLPPALWDRVRDGRFRIVHNTAGSARPNMRRKKELGQ